MTPLHFDWTINPTILALGIGLLWKASALVTEFRNLVGRFSDHEDRDDERFKSIDARFDSVTARIEDLKERINRHP